MGIYIYRAKSNLRQMTLEVTRYSVTPWDGLSFLKCKSGRSHYRRASYSIDASLAYCAVFSVHNHS